MNSTVSAGVVPIGSAPCPDNFSFTSGVSRMRRASACNFATISGGVFPGASMPCHDPVTKSGMPASANVGVSGSAALRCALEVFHDFTAYGFTRGATVNPRTRFFSMARATNPVALTSSMNALK